MTLSRQRAPLRVSYGTTQGGETVKQGSPGCVTRPVIRPRHLVGPTQHSGPAKSSVSHRGIGHARRQSLGMSAVSSLRGRSRVGYCPRSDDPKVAALSAGRSAPIRVARVDGLEPATEQQTKRRSHADHGAAVSCVEWSRGSQEPRDRGPDTGRPRAPVQSQRGTYPRNGPRLALGLRAPLLQCWNRSIEHTRRDQHPASVGQYGFPGSCEFECLSGVQRPEIEPAPKAGQLLAGTEAHSSDHATLYRLAWPGALPQRPATLPTETSADARRSETWPMIWRNPSHGQQCIGRAERGHSGRTNTVESDVRLSLFAIQSETLYRSELDSVASRDAPSWR